MEQLFDPQPEGSSRHPGLPERSAQDGTNCPRVNQYLLTEQTAVRALVPVLFGILLLWNWRFALALLVGSCTMNLAVSIRSAPWNQTITRIRQQYLNGENLPMVLAAMGGIVATVGTYTGLSMWTQSSDRWLAIGAIAQGLVSSGILYVLAWQAWRQPLREDTAALDVILQHMLAPTPARRLLSAQQLQRFIRDGQLTIEQHQFVETYLQTVLEQESDRRVREQLLTIWQQNFV
ncbi:MAG: hypothetical protein AB4040_12730 [Synechococcus sp.]